LPDFAFLYGQGVDVLAAPFPSSLSSSSLRWGSQDQTAAAISACGGAPPMHARSVSEGSGAHGSEDNPTNLVSSSSSQQQQHKVGLAEISREVMRLEAAEACGCSSNASLVFLTEEQIAVLEAVDLASALSPPAADSAGDASGGLARVGEEGGGAAKKECAESQPPSINAAAAAAATGARSRRANSTEAASTAAASTEAAAAAASSALANVGDHIKFPWKPPPPPPLPAAAQGGGTAAAAAAAASLAGRRREVKAVLEKAAARDRWVVSSRDENDGSASRRDEDPSEVFVEEIERAIALGRAAGLEGMLSPAAAAALGKSHPSAASMARATKAKIIAAAQPPPSLIRSASAGMLPSAPSATTAEPMAAKASALCLPTAAVAGFVEAHSAVAGGRWVSEALRDSYVALLRARERRRERRRAGHRHLELCRLSPGRPSPLGEDRWGHRFFAYPSDPMPLRVWVDLAKKGGAGSPREPDPATTALLSGYVCGSWVASVESVRALALSLDWRGVKERALREALLCHAEAVSEPGVRAGTTATALFLNSSTPSGGVGGSGRDARTKPPPSSD